MPEGEVGRGKRRRRSARGGAEGGGGPRERVSGGALSPFILFPRSVGPTRRRRRRKGFFFPFSLLRHRCVRASSRRKGADNEGNEKRRKASISLPPLSRVRVRRSLREDRLSKQKGSVRKLTFGSFVAAAEERGKIRERVVKQCIVAVFS